MNRVCVLMSTYNGELYIERQLDSILNQKGNFELEIFIRDDGSKDGTIHILQRYEENYSQIKVIYGSNIGWMKSFNELLFQSNDADYYSFSDQDDIWMPNKLDNGIKKIESSKYSGAVLYGSNVIEVDSDLNLLHDTTKINYRNQNGFGIMMKGFTLGCTMIFNHAAKEIYLSSPHKMNHVGHDWLLATLCAYFGILIFDEDAYIYHIRHGNNATGSLGIQKILLSKWKLFCKKQIGYTIYEELYTGYKNQLPKRDLKIIEDFINYKKSILARCRLILNPRVKKYTIKGTLLLKLSLLFNRHV